MREGILWPPSFYEGAVDAAEREAAEMRYIAARDDAITRLRTEVEEQRARAEQAERERDELSDNGAAIVGALEERDMARAERDEARARIRELEAALRPFAAAADRLAHEHDSTPVLLALDTGVTFEISSEAPFTVGDLRHAAALLAPTTPTPDQAGEGEVGP